MNRTTKTREARIRHVKACVESLVGRGMTTKKALEVTASSIFISTRTATNDYYGN